MQVHGQHMACLISSLDMNNIFKAKVLEVRMFHDWNYRLIAQNA
jgi:hypothetical protein